jgi:hypothetical protein
MSRLPKSVAVLVGIFVFCGSVLTALLLESAVAPAVIRGAVCALAAGLVANVCTRIGLGVVCEGVARAAEEETAGRTQSQADEP